MREIKFRAWHKGYDRPAVKTPIKPQMLYEDRVGQCLMWLEQGQPLEVMQFTGLKDRNGREIYEGDILKITCPQDGEMVGHVVFESDKGRFAWEENSADSPYGLETNDSHNEVIGNIYENPELLEAK